MRVLSFGAASRQRAVNLTPMIDVVFLLLVFFMLVAQFGADRALPLTLGLGSAPYSGPPRLVTVAPTGLSLNGVAVRPDALAAQVARLVSGPNDIIVLRAEAGASTQALINAMALLQAAGHTHLVLVK